VTSSCLQPREIVIFNNKCASGKCRLGMLIALNIYLLVVKRNHDIMKRHLKSIAGVTLLEIMLVLAVASLIIVMSIRYYKTSIDNQNSNVILEDISAVMAAADGIAASGNTYTNVTTAGVTGVLGSYNSVTPYGGTFTISSPSASGYVGAVALVPSSVCGALVGKMTGMPHLSAAVPTCSATGLLQWTYNITVP